MIRIRVKKIKNKIIKINFFIGFVFFILFLIFLFSIFNLISVIKLQNQINVIITDKKNDLINESVSDKTEDVITSTSTIYYNGASEPFFSNTQVNKEKTNLYLDDNVTAMTFKPLYDLKVGETCDKSFCGKRVVNNLSCLDSGCVFKNNNQLYLNNSLIKSPAILGDKKIVNISINQLQSKWLIGFVISEDKQEIGYAYLFDGLNWEPIITNQTDKQIKTEFGYGGGSISAGGSDNQFIILYSGYEGFAYLYNNGNLQDLSGFFGLRVVNHGFEAKILKGGDGKLANWYVCSNDGKNSKFVKLWQNNTDNIQGAIDLSKILKNDPIICDLKGDREVNIIGKKSYTFTDNGFDNSLNYTYQSNNLSTYFDKKIIAVNLDNYKINATPDSYKLFISLDAKNWQAYLGQETKLFNENNLNTFFIKAILKTGNKEYSPWLDGFGLISYQAIDM